MKPRTQTAGSRGFSLIEVTIGILILGILMIPTIALYEKYRQDHIRAATKNNPGDVAKALQKYVVLYGRYPRPARPDLGIEDVNSGREAPDPTPLALDAADFPVCTATSAVVCRALAVNPPTGTLTNQILIGVVPFAEIGLPRELAIDGHGRRLTYAVRWGLTIPGAFPNPANETLSGTGLLVTNSTGGNAPNTVGANVHFVVISHGEDGRGAFASAAGVKFATCTGPGADIENCNNDGVFNFNNNIASVEDEIPEINRGTDAAGTPLAAYFDDTVMYQTSTVGQGEKWSRLAGTVDVINRTAKPVQIGLDPGGGTPDPVATLEVWGNVQANELHTDRLCAQGGCGTGAFSPGIIGGPAPTAFAPGTLQTSYADGDIRCGDEQAMLGIRNSNERCQTGSGANIGLPNFPACPSGTAPAGVTGTGSPLCAAP